MYFTTKNIRSHITFNYVNITSFTYCYRRLWTPWVFLGTGTYPGIKTGPNIFDCGPCKAHRPPSQLNTTTKLQLAPHQAQDTRRLYLPAPPPLTTEQKLGQVYLTMISRGTEYGLIICLHICARCCAHLRRCVSW